MRGPTSIGTHLLVALGLTCALTLAGCGSTSADPEPTTVVSHKYSCTDAALAQQKAMRTIVAQQVDDLVGRPKLTDYCDTGMDAGVEFRMRGESADVAPEIASVLACGSATYSRVALGRQANYRCHDDKLWFRLSLVQYLPASDPKGPVVLGVAVLVTPPA